MTVISFLLNRIMSEAARGLICGAFLVTFWFVAAGLFQPLNADTGLAASSQRQLAIAVDELYFVREEAEVSRLEINPGSIINQAFPAEPGSSIVHVIEGKTKAYIPVMLIRKPDGSLTMEPGSSSTFATAIGTEYVVQGTVKTNTSGDGPPFSFYDGVALAKNGGRVFNGRFTMANNDFGLTAKQLAASDQKPLIAFEWDGLEIAIGRGADSVAATHLNIEKLVLVYYFSQSGKLTPNTQYSFAYNAELISEVDNGHDEDGRRLFPSIIAQEGYSKLMTVPVYGENATVDVQRFALKSDGDILISLVTGPAGKPIGAAYHIEKKTQ